MQWPPIIVFVLTATATVPSVADAQSLAEDPREAAARDYGEARRLFKAGEYRGALRLFQSAHEAFPNAETLDSMGRCYEELGQYLRAVEVYDRLLQEHPTYSQREGVEQALAELRGHIADTEEAEDAPRGNLIGGGGWVHEDSQTDAHLQATRMTRGRKISWGVLASGLAIGAVGAGLLIRGAVLHHEFEETSSDFITADAAGRESIHNDLTRMAEMGEPLVDAGWGLTISGLAISCASILLLVFVPGKEPLPGGSGSRANVNLSLNGLSFAGSF
jgi:hypothetical protein